MKLRSATPASFSRIVKRVAFIGVALLVAVAAVPLVTQQFTSADQYDEKIARLQREMKAFQAEADRLNKRADSLATALAKLTNEKRALQSQIDLNQAQHDKLTKQIKETEAKIAENQDALGETLADLYVDDSISPIEMLASSQNIGDFLNKQEYRNSVKDELSTTIKTVKQLKAELDEKRAEVAKVLKRQKAARASLEEKESQQASLLSQTRNSEARYQALIEDRKDEIAAARATQAAIRARLSGSGGYVLVDAGSLGDYPWNASNCPMWGYLSTGGADGNGGDGHGYGCRQCASYVAWKIAKETGIYYSWGNAKDFDNRAIAAGYQPLGMNPQPGSIAVMEPATAGQGFGHVAWVEAVSGNMVTISQYNYDYGQGYGMYSMMTLSKYAFDSYVKIN